MALVLGADGANELRLRIGQQSQRIGIETNVRPVFLAVAGHAFEKLLAFFRGFDAHTEDLYTFRNVSFRLVDEGRHLGPAPGSPAAAVEKHHRGRRRAKGHGKLDCRAVHAQELRGGKIISDL